MKKGNRAPINGSHITQRVAGITLSGPRDLVDAAASAINAAPAPIYPDDMTDDLREVLGWMCFQCIEIAQCMRLAGVHIDRRAEDEQAHVLHWLVKLALRHGANWREAGREDLQRMREVAAKRMENAA